MWIEKKKWNAIKHPVILRPPSRSFTSETISEFLVSSNAACLPAYLHREEMSMEVDFPHKFHFQSTPEM
jgi:hypothetical protein